MSSRAASTGWDTVRCYRKHREDNPAIGQSIAPRKVGRRAAGKAKEATRRTPRPGLEPKTVVNTHRMLHRAWEDFTVWGWVKRNFVNDAHPPRVPRKVWTVDQLQVFLRCVRSDRFFALWVLEATSGIRRSELAGARRGLLNLEAGTLALEPPGFPWTARSSSRTARPRTLAGCWPWTRSRWRRSGRTWKCWTVSAQSSVLTIAIPGCSSAGRTAVPCTRT
jgi:integrase